MDDGLPSVFTPFARRFTDEKALNLRDTQRLYDKVRERHIRFGTDTKRASVKKAVWDNLDRWVEMSEFYMPMIDGLIEDMLDAEDVVFGFPERVEVARLALKEQTDLTRFLYAKQHALDNERRVLDLLADGISRLLAAHAEKLPTVSLLDEPLFSVPFLTTLSEPGVWISKLYGTLTEDTFVDNGVFANLGHQLSLNLAEASGNDLNAPKRPWKHAYQNNLPAAELVKLYLRGTPFTKLFELPVPLTFDEETRFSHMHIVGGSGAGKTQLLQHLILHDLQSDDPPALIIVDSQTDLISKLSHLALFDPDHGKLKDRLLIITPREIEHPPAINIFDVNKERLDQYDDATKEQVVAGVIQTFDYLFTGLLGTDLTTKQGVFFKFLARLMLSLPETMGRNATILDFLNIMDDPSPYQVAMDSLPPLQRNFFARDFMAKGFGATREQIRYRLNAILENPTLARLFSSTETKVDLFDALNNNGIILVDTAKDFLKGSSAHFGRIFISLVLQAILERAAIPEHKRKPAFLIVDEAANYFDSNMDDLLTEARKYKLGCVFAHQFLDQASSGLKSSLAANTAIKMAAGVSTNDARTLAPDMRTTTDFILKQSRLSFASYIRGATASAVSIPVPVGRLEGEKRMSDDAYTRLREENWKKVSLPLRPHEAQPQKVPSDQPKPVEAKSAKSSHDAGTDSTSDW